MSQKVKLLDFPTSTRLGRKTVVQPMSNEEKIVISDPARGAPGGEVGFRADSRDELDALNALLDDQTPLLLQLPADTNWHDTWCALGDDDEEAMASKNRDSKMQKTMSWDAVGVPTGNLVSWE
jgi:hypothetical protein